MAFLAKKQAVEADPMDNARYAAAVKRNDELKDDLRAVEAEIAGWRQAGAEEQALEYIAHGAVTSGPQKSMHELLARREIIERALRIHSEELELARREAHRQYRAALLPEHKALARRVYNAMVELSDALVAEYRWRDARLDREAVEFASPLVPVRPYFVGELDFSGCGNVKPFIAELAAYLGLTGA